MSPNRKVDILIPGNWHDKRDLGGRLASAEKCLFLGMVLRDLKTSTHYTAWVTQDWTRQNYCEEFPELALGKTEDPQRGDSIPSVFVIESEVGSVEQLKILCKVISALLEVGGLGVKITNCGKVISKEVWQKLSFCPQTLFEIFVSICHTEKGVFSCGMSNFGSRDVFAPLTKDADSIGLIQSFAWYVLQERPVIKDGETFSLHPESPNFKILESTDEVNRGTDHPFYNPLGFWKLWPLEWLKN